MKIKIWTNFNCNYIETSSKSLKKLPEICEKIDKMWISYRITPEKMQRKLGNVLVMSNIYWNFEKKLEEYSEKLRENFENLWENF